MGRAEPIAGFIPEPLQRAEPRADAPSRIARSELPMMPRTPLRPVETPTRASAMRLQERAAIPPVPPAPTPAPVPATNVSADQNLADMAQRLEAALRRPAGEARPDNAEPRVGAPPVAPEPPPSRPAPRSSGEASVAAAAPKAAPPSPVPSPSPKTGFENLEDEMASLLGRPKTPS